MDSNQSPLPLQNLSDSGQPPSTRIKDADDAQSIVAYLIQANEQRSYFFAKIQGAIDGNPPYDPSKLKRDANSWRFNVNFMETLASVRSAMVPYYDLFSASKYFAEVALEDPDYAKGQQASQVVTEEFDRLLREWQGFDYNVQSVMYDRLVFGRAFAVWDNPVDWRFHHIPMIRVLVPDGTPADLENVELVVVRQNYRLHQLYKFAEQTDYWNQAAVYRSIRNAGPDTQQDTSSDYDYVQQLLRDRDVSESTRSQVVRCGILFVREFNGRVSKYVVDTRRTSDDKKAEYLLEHRDCYESMQQAVAGFFLETLDGSWNGTRGLGHEIYSVMEGKNRLLCTALDNAFMRSGITLAAQSEQALQKTALVRIGAVNILPPFYNVQNSTIFGDVEGMLGVNRALDDMLSSNTGVYKARLDKATGNPETATQVQLRYQHAAQLSNSAVTRFYFDLDRLYAETFRRVVNETTDQAAKDFRKRCLDRGVKAEQLKKIKCVRSYRVFGNGSLYLRQQSVQSLLGLAPMMNEAGRQNLLDDAIATATNFSAVERYNPKPEMPQELDDHKAMAVLENAAMKSGAQVQWTKTQNNTVHLGEHFQAAFGALASLQQGADPTSISGFLDIIGPHIGKHLQELSKDSTKKDEVKMWQEQLKQLATAKDKLDKELAKRIEEETKAKAQAMVAQQTMQAIQNGTDPDTQVAMAKAQADAKVKEFKAAHAAKIKEMTTAQKLRLADLTAANNIRNQNAQTAANLKAQQAGQGEGEARGGNGKKSNRIKIERDDKGRATKVSAITDFDLIRDESGRLTELKPK